MKLIDKDAVVAEINKLKGKVSDGSSYCNGWQHTLRMLEIEMNALEVKEVNFEDSKSIFEGQYLSKDKVVTTIERLQDECEEQDDNNGVELLEKLFNKLDTLEVKEVDLERELDKEWNKCEPIDEGMGLEIASIEHEQFDNIAKHFFELGMQVSNKAQKGE